MTPSDDLMPPQDTEPRHSSAVPRWVAPVNWQTAHTEQGQPSKEIPLTEHGLLDSATLGGDWYTGPRPQRAEDLIGASFSYVLLAPGGAGKTTLVEYLKHCEPDSSSIDLRLDGREVLTELLSSLSSSEPSTSGVLGGTVFVDAVDEALQVDPNIGYVLVKLLSGPGSNRVAWRFACRPGSWTVDLANGLRTALPGFEELELLPLSLAGIREMAGAGAAADDFLTAVQRAHLTHLLAHPLHALDLLDHWQGSGQLPASRSDSMQLAVTRMLTETSITRLPGKVDDDRRLLIAERLAAIFMLCGVSGFALSPSMPRPAERRTRLITDLGTDAAPLTVTSVPTQAEPDLFGSQLTIDGLREVLHTALFTVAGHSTVTFTHQSYAEFLAAKYLSRRRVAGQRLISILGADVNGLVPGPMIEVLGWLLALNSPVPEALITDNVKQLLSTAGLELSDDQVRERVVGALLYGAASGSLDEGWRTDTSALSHSGLAAQLHRAKVDASNYWVVFWICRIARQCAVLDAADDVLEIALETVWPAFIRAEAVKTFAEVAPRARMAELAPLLDLNSREDPHDEILAAALRAVLPDAVEFGHIRGAIRPRRTPNYIGNFDRLLGELPSLIPNGDVVPTLVEALNRRPEHIDRAFDRLIGALLQRTWATRNPATAAAIGAALGNERLSRQQTLRDEHLPWLTDDDPEIRRVMAAAALAAHEHSFAAALDLHILTPADLKWLIDWMRTAPREALASARVALRLLAWNVADADSADQVLNIDKEHPAYEVLADFQGHCEISSRPDWWNHAENDDGPSSPELESQVRDHITHAREDVNSWWDAVVALSGDRTNPDPEVLFAWDLTSRPMWSTLTDDEQDEFLRLGLGYLGTRQPDISRWQGQDQWTLDDVMPDWAAVFLLATLATHRPDLLSGVERSVWVSWATAITVIPNFMSDQGWQRRIRDAAPEAGRDAIDDALCQQVQQGNSVLFSYHPLADFSDNRLITVIQQEARNPENSTTHRDEAIGVLIEHAPDIALEVARTAMREEVVPPSAFTALAKLAPDELVAEWITHGRLGPAEHLQDLDPTRLSNDSLAALTGILLDELPFAEDTAQGDEFARSTPTSTARQLRIQLLQLMAGRGMVSSLTTLGHGRPAADVEQIQHLLQEARTREALANWRPLQPSTLMNLLAHGDARLVRDSSGLLTVLLEQLDQIQHDLHASGTFRSLWDGEPGSAGAKPKNEDTISDWLAEQLRLRLRPHVVVDREVQVTRPKPIGIGTRIDITATSGGADVGRVIFEAKLVNNSGLLTAIDNQLVAQYMEPAMLTHGIYIVYWTTRELRPLSWHKKHQNAEELAEELRAQARRHQPAKHIEVVVLDVGLTP